MIKSKQETYTTKTCICLYNNTGRVQIKYSVDMYLDKTFTEKLFLALLKQ